MLLSLLLFSAGVLLALGALVERPGDSHGHGEAAASTGGHEIDDPAPAIAVAENDQHDSDFEVATDETEDHGTVSVGLPDEGAEHIDGSAGSSSSESDHSEDGHKEQARSILGVDRDSLNLAYPWWTTVVIALTILLAAALAAKAGVGLLMSTVGIGLTGVAVGIAEAFHAGEELGIFVPLPILAAVLYGGAGGLASLALIAAKNQLVAAPGD